MKIPSLDKEFLLQHCDYGIASSIQWFFIESVRKSEQYKFLISGLLTTQPYPQLSSNRDHSFQQIIWNFLAITSTLLFRGSELVDLDPRP